MKVERKRWDEVTILHFVGEFDAFNLPTYSQKIDAMVEAGDSRMVFNLHLLTFINSSALGYLLKVKKRCQELGGDLVLVAPSKFIKKTLVTLGLQEVFAIFETNEDGVLFYKRPQDSKAVKIGAGDAEKDEKLSGANAVMFRVVDDTGTDLFGHTPQVGRIHQLAEGSLVLRWEVPAPGPKHLVPISTDNFDSAVHPGTRMRLKFRQPFAMKSHYFEMGGLVSKVAKEAGAGGATTAVVTVEYQDMSADDKTAITGFVQDLARFREVLGQAGENI